MSSAYETEDFIIQVLLFLVFLVQLIPAYFSWRVYRLNGYARYWTEAWFLFLVVMLLMAFRRAMVLFHYDYTCELTRGWIFDM